MLPFFLFCFGVRSLDLVPERPEGKFLYTETRKLWCIVLYCTVVYCIDGDRETQAGPCNTTVKRNALAAWNIKLRVQSGNLTFANHHYNSSIATTPLLLFSFALLISNTVHISSDPQARSFRKFQNVIWILLVMQRSFTFIAAAVWNSLPTSLRNLPTLYEFKTQFIKTFLSIDRPFQKPR